MNYNEDLEWEIGVTLSHYAKSRKKNKKELYTKAILINTQIGYGIVYVLDDFIHMVDSGYFIDYDGCGDALDINGEEICSIRCDVNFLQSLKNKGCEFIAWYNK